MEVRKDQNRFGLVIGKQFDETFTNLACKQVGFKGSKSPIKLLKAANFAANFSTFYRLKENATSNYKNVTVLETN